MRRAILAMLAMARVAYADRAILIEATTPGEPSLDAQVAATQRALGDVLAGAPLAATLDARLGPPPPRLSPGALSLLQARVKQAERNLFFNGAHVRESIADLEDARARLSDAQGSLAHDPEARALLQYVLVKLTRAYQIEHVPDAARLAEARVEELLRLFPDRPLDPEHNERELCELYDRVKKRLVAGARLAVPLPSGAQLHVEGMTVAGAPPPLPPGAYRLFASDVHGDGRLHRVEVGTTARLTIDVPLETALRDEPTPALVFGSPSLRAAEEAKLVARLGRALDVSRVYVLGSSPEATVALWAYDVGAGERARLRAVVGTRESPPPLARMTERLAAELMPGAAAPGEPRLVLVYGRQTADPLHLTSIVARAGPLPPPRRLRALEVAGWTFVAAGLPAATVGAALWPRAPGPRAAIPLVAAGATLALMGSDWLLVAAAIRGRRHVGRAVAIVTAAWVAGALASGLAQLR